MENLSFYPPEKEKLYPLLVAQLRSISEGEAPISAASNAAALPVTPGCKIIIL